MKKYRVAVLVAGGLIVSGYGIAQAVLTENAVISDSTTTEVVPLAVPATVVVPVAVSVSNPPTTVSSADREKDKDGDWYVVRGTIELDRQHDMLKVKDYQGNLTEMQNNDNVIIYRQGRPISYLEVNNGDSVTVRYKSI